MKRKWLFLVALAIIATLAFVACSGNDDGDTGTQDPPTGQQDQQQEQDTPAPPPETGTDDNGEEPANGGDDNGDDNGDEPAPPTAEELIGTYRPVPQAAEGQTVIELWAFTDEIPNAVMRYKDENPEFAERFYVNPVIISTDDGMYQLALDMALANGEPDMFVAEAGFVVRYTQGDMAHHALPLSELGIENLMGRIAAGQIARYTVELGTRDGEVVGLAFQQTGGALIYRRSLAEQVWGNDDPEFIRNQVGPGWDRFLEAAAELDEHGISIVSGTGDVWQAIRNTGGPWIVGGRLDIHPDRMAFYDIARELYQNGWMNETDAWSGAWNADMSGTGARPVFAFLGPAWLINHVMSGHVGATYGDWAIAVPPTGFNWGGSWIIPAASASDDAREGIRELIEWITLDTSEDGFQHHWANGTLLPGSTTVDTVASAVVMDAAIAAGSGEIPLLGGQNMFEVFIPAGAYADGTLFTQHDESINSWFIDTAMYYARGDLSRDDALAAFRQLVYENLGIE